jgi:hypothetical protein
MTFECSFVSVQVAAYLLAMAIGVWNGSRAWVQWGCYASDTSSTLYSSSTQVFGKLQPLLQFWRSSCSTKHETDREQAQFTAGSRRLEEIHSLMCDVFFSLQSSPNLAYPTLESGFTPLELWKKVPSEQPHTIKTLRGWVRYETIYESYCR